MSLRFSKIVIDAAHVFHVTELSFAFVNKKPVLPGHVLVCPIRVVPRLRDLEPVELTDLFLTAQRVGVVLETEYGSTSGTLAVQDGPDAGQTIPHVHVHLLPRKPCDFDRNDDVYEKLEKHDQNPVKANFRGWEEMAAEASRLRKHFSS